MLNLINLPDEVDALVRNVPLDLVLVDPEVFGGWLRIRHSIFKGRYDY